MFFTTPSGIGPSGYDYDCDGVATRQYPSAGNCIDAGSCVLVPGWNPGSGSIPACGVSAGFVMGCSSGCFVGSSPPLTQACR